ncbi:hypothetical protein KCU71_g5980, partial [Aureobasidium melanogenum]
MDEDLQAPGQLAADIKVTEKKEASSNKKASNYLQNLIDTFFSKSEEYEAHHCASRNIYERFQRAHDAVEDHLENTGLVVHMISTDSISMLDDYSRLMTLENKRINRQADFLAQKRVGLTMLDELLGLGEKIMVNHASELKNVNFEIRESLTPTYIQRSFATLLRSDLESYILQQSRQANMNDHAHENDHPTGEGDSHRDDTSSTPAAKARYERAMELESQAQTLSREMDKIDAEGHQHYREWNRYNRRYLRLQKRTGNTAEPLVLNIDNTAQLQQASALLALDAQRANTQLAMTQIRQRLLEIQAELKKMYIEFAMLLGSQESPGFAKDMQRFSEEEKRHHKMRKELGEQMLKRAIVQVLRPLALTTPTQSETTKNNVQDLDNLLAAVSDLRLATQDRITSLLSHLAGHIRSLQYHTTYHNPTRPHSRAGNAFNLQMMMYHSQKRLEFQALIQETLGQGSQLINKVLVLLGEKAELLYVEIDSDEMRQWLYDWAGFGLELDRSQRVLNEAITERP